MICHLLFFGRKIKSHQFQRQQLATKGTGGFRHDAKITH